MPIEIGRRASSFINARIFTPARSYIHESRTHQRVENISPASPVTFVSAARTTAVVNGIMESLNRGIEMTAELKAQNLGVGRSQVLDFIRQEEDRATETIWGAGGKYLNRMRESFSKFAEHMCTDPAATLKETAKKYLINLPMAAAAFYSLGLILSTFAIPTSALAVVAVVSNIAIFAFSNLHLHTPSNPTMRKINDYFKTWGLMGAGLSFLISTPLLLLRHDLSVINTFKLLPSWGLYGIAGAAALTIIFKVINAVIKHHNSRMSMKEAPEKWAGTTMHVASKLAYYSKLGALMYILPLYLGALFRFASMTMANDPIFAVTTVLGALFVGQFFSNYKGGMKNLLIGNAIGMAPLALWGGTSFLAFPTFFLFAPLCMLISNFHSGIPALSSATNHIGALHYPAIPDVSDTFKEDISYGVRGSKGHNVIRLNAFMNNRDTNFSNLINMLINPYPDVEFELCEEKKPWSGVGDMKRAMIMKQYLEFWRTWQTEIRGRVLEEYKKLDDPKLTLDKKYESLAALYNWFGKQLSEETEWIEETEVNGKKTKRSVTPFLKKLTHEYQKDAARSEGDQWFNQGLAPQFYAEGFQVMKDRAKSFFFPLQERFAARAKGLGGGMHAEELKKEYLRLLDIYSIRSNYIIRRLEHLDDQINQKTNNLSFALTHSGDTLYKVWVLPRRGIDAFEDRMPVEHIPSLYVRVDNPEYVHDTSKKKYLWIHRNDLKTVNEPLQFSESGSEEIELVNNTPNELSTVTYKQKPMNGIESDEEVLPIVGFKLRAFEKDGKTAADRLRSKYLWAPRMEKSQVTGCDAAGNASLAAVDPGQFDRSFMIFAAQRYMNIDLKKSADRKALKKILDQYIIFADLCARKGPEEAVRIYQEKYNKDKQDKLGNYLALTGGKLWFENPETLIFKAVDLNDYMLVSDEEYIDFSSYIQLQGELQRDAQQQKDLRVFRYMPRQEEIPYPWTDEKHDPSRIRHIERIGAPVEISFTIKQNGEEIKLMVPYQENRTLLNAGTLGPAKWEWKDITHGIAVRDKKTNKKIIELYTFLGKPDEDPVLGKENFKKIGTISEEDYPDQLPPPEILNPDKDPTKNQIFKFTAFPERVGIYGYYMFDFGEVNGGKEPWQRYRFVRESEKPWQLWLNLITGMKLDPKKKKLTINALYPEAQVVPFNTAWANPGEETKSLLDVAKVDTGRGRWVAKYQRADGTLYYEYAPTEKDLPTAGRVAGSETELKGENAIGLVRYTTKSGDVRESIVPLTGDLKGYADPKKARDIIQASLDEKRSQLEIIEGCQFTNKYSSETAASYLYTLKDHAKLVNEKGDEVVIPNYLWIKQTHIEQKGNDFIVVVVTENPYTKETKPHRILGSCLVDEEGKELLRNHSRGMDSMGKFFQKEKGNYTAADERYRPEFMLFEGLPTLRLHAIKEKRKKIILSDKTKAALSEVLPADVDKDKIEILISSPTSSAKVEEKETGRERWVPLSLVDPVDNRQLKDEDNFHPGKAIITDANGERVEYYEDLRIAKANYEGNPNVRFEQAVAFRPDIIHGDFGMVVHRQNSFGGSDAAEVRDQYFYARHHGKGCEIRYPKGEFEDPRLSVGLQSGKTNIYDANRISHSDAIENGTPFMANFRILHELANITGFRSSSGQLHAGNLEASIHHPFTRKLVTFSVFMGCLNGVSEDEELKRVMKKATARKLRYCAYPTAVVAQPNEISKLKGQNCERYNTSSQLFNDIEWGQVVREIWNGWILHNMPTVFAPKELLETCMTGFWYPGLPYSEIGQMMGPSVYLFSGGNIQPFIVDHLIFLNMVLADTGLSGVNYGLARYHGGFKPFSWSFWNAPARDPISLIGGYWRGSRRMISEDWQYGQFVITADQKGKSLPDSQKSFLRMFTYSGGAATMIGWSALALAIPVIGLSWLTVFPLLAIGLNAFWGTYKFALSLKALSWLRTLETDLKDNPQDIEELGKKIDALVYDDKKGKDKINSLLGARQLTKSVLLELGIDPFKIENNPSRSEDQVRALLHTSFVIDNHLLELAKEMGKEGNTTEDQLIGMALLKNLGYNSVSHDVGKEATDAYKRVILKRDEIAPLMNLKITQLTSAVDPKKPSLNLDEISACYHTISAAWDQLGRKERKISARQLKILAEKLGAKVIKEIDKINLTKVDEIETLLLPLISQTLHLPIGAKQRKAIGLKTQEKIRALLQLNSTKPENLKKEELNLLFNFSSLGMDKASLPQANQVKINILKEFNHRSNYPATETNYRAALNHFSLFLGNLKSIKALSALSSADEAPELVRHGNWLILANQKIQIAQAEGDAEKIRAANDSAAKAVQKLEKLVEELLAIKSLIEHGIDRLNNLSALEGKKKELENFVRGIIAGSSKAYNKESEAALGIQKEILLLATDQRDIDQARQRIEDIFENQLKMIKNNVDAKTKMDHLKIILESLTGFNNKKDEELGFEAMPRLRFILKELIPNHMDEIIAIVDSCGAQALEIVTHSGGNNPMTPERGGIIDRVLRLRQRKVKLSQRLPLLRKPEQQAELARQLVFKHIVQDASRQVGQYNQDLATSAPSKAIEEDLAELAATCDRLIKLLQDLRALNLAEQKNGTIETIEKLLQLERVNVLELKAKAARNSATDDDRTAYNQAKDAYLTRVENFKGAAKVFVEKKHLKKFHWADKMPTLDRPPTGTPKQKAEINGFFEAIERTFPKEEVE